MSSTNRGRARKRADFYPTPPWCVHRLLEAVELRGGRWLEPTAGRGDLMAAVRASRDDISWTGVELFAARAKRLATVADVVLVGDIRKVDLEAHYDVALSNPPFSIWQDVVTRVLPLADTVAMLLRLDVLGSAGRAAWWHEHPADVLVIPDRPSFTSDGGTDSNVYGWFVWRRGARRGQVRVLPVTSLAERAGPRGRRADSKTS